jgi:phage-related protein
LTEDNIGRRIKEFMASLTNGIRVYTATTSSIKLASISKVFNFAGESVSATSKQESHVQKGHQNFSAFIC